MKNILKSLEGIKIKDKSSKIFFGKLIKREFQKQKHLNLDQAKQLLYLAYLHQVPQIDEMLDEIQFNIKSLKMKIEHHISNTSGRWLINGKKYTDLSNSEKIFFNEFVKKIKSQNK